MAMPIRFDDEDAIAQVLQLESLGLVQVRHGPKSKSHRHYGMLLWIDVTHASPDASMRLEAMKAQRTRHH
ncbi:MAG: hypothetical protein O9327_02250 [Polaromonas sp.]|nr:hypothetical protein [Polaromonas sp.]